MQRAFLVLFMIGNLAACPLYCLAQPGPFGRASIAQGGGCPCCAHRTANVPVKDGGAPARGGPEQGNCICGGALLLAEVTIAADDGAALAETFWPRSRGISAESLSVGQDGRLFSNPPGAGRALRVRLLSLQI